VCVYSALWQSYGSQYYSNFLVSWRASTSDTSTDADIDMSHEYEYRCRNKGVNVSCSRTNLETANSYVRTGVNVHAVYQTLLGL
jgi:hypothetical protein